MVAFKNRFLFPTIAVEFFEIGKCIDDIGTLLCADSATFSRLFDNWLISKILIADDFVCITHD